MLALRYSDGYTHHDFLSQPNIMADLSHTVNILVAIRALLLNDPTTSSLDHDALIP